MQLFRIFLVIAAFLTVLVMFKTGYLSVCSNRQISIGSEKCGRVGTFPYATPQVTPSSFPSPVVGVNEALFQKDEGRGPCLVGEICVQKTILYRSGELVLTGKVTRNEQISQVVLNQIIDKIRKSGIMQKECEGGLVTDVYAESKIILDGQEKVIIFPGCADELGEIESLFL